MSLETVTSIRELDSRVNHGVEVKLLWCSSSERVWVSVIDARSGDAFCLEVQEGEPPLDVFHHPYAYADHHGIVTAPPRIANEPDQAFAT